MNSDRLTVLPGPLEHNEINDLGCQPGVTAHTEPKVQSGEVSTLLADVVAIPSFITDSPAFVKAFHGGSRVMCRPAPTNTDDDYVVFVSGDLVQYRSSFDTMSAAGFDLGGSKALNNAGFNRFQSWKRDDLNIILTQNEAWYEAMLLATKVCAALNIREKHRRIKIFEAIVYGMAP